MQIPQIVFAHSVKCRYGLSIKVKLYRSVDCRIYHMTKCAA